MDNFLSNGTVLPSGLLSSSASSMMDGFKKTYQNSYLRIGVVVNTYDIGNPQNVSKDTIEYDVLAWQQNEGGSATAITYKHCIAATSFGSIADFFEARLRQIENKTTVGVTPTPYGQDGAMVLLLCLNGFSDSAIIISSLSNPQRQSTLTGSDLHLEGEYNGVNIKVNSDGSTSLTFKGATNNDGEVINPSQGNTEFQIQTDGSFEFKHSTITIQANRSGVLNITTAANTNIIVSGNTNITTTGTTNITSNENINVNTLADVNITAANKIIESAKEIDLNGNGQDLGRGITTANSHAGVIDLITGVPVDPSITVFGDV